MENGLRRIMAEQARKVILHEMHGEMPLLAALLADYDELRRDNEELQRNNEELRRQVDELSKLAAQMSKGDKACAFLAGLPSMTTDDAELKAKIDAAFYTIQDDDTIWFGLRDLPHEEWRDVAGFESFYQVSNLGRVKSLRGRKILRAGLNRDGYLAIWTSVGCKKIGFLVHRLVAGAFLLNTKGLPEVNHKRGIKTDNRVAELEWIGRLENVQHAVCFGLYSCRKGFNAHNRRLSDNDVRYIRENPDCLSYRELADLFRVSRGTIYKVCKGLSYPNVK